MDTLPILRTSERNLFRRCPQAWWWGYREGLVPKGMPNYNLWFGGLWHICMADWYGKGYRRGKHPAKRWRELCTEEFVQMKSFEGDVKEYHDALDLGIAMGEHYVDTYGKDPDWYVIETERTRKIAIYDETGTQVGWYLYTTDGAYLDRADHNKRKLMEHKTASIISTSHLSLDDQGGTYLAFETLNLRAEGKIGPDEQIDEITYNFARKAIKKVDDRPRNLHGEALNKDGSVSKNQGTQAPLLLRYPVPRSAEYRAQAVDRIVIELRHMARMRADPDGELFKSPQQGPFGCGTCSFHEMCELHEEGADWQEFRDWKYRVKDPYETYRKAS